MVDALDYSAKLRLHAPHIVIDSPAEDAPLGLISRLQPTAARLLRCCKEVTDFLSIVRLITVKSPI